MRITFHDKLSRMAALAAAAGMCGIFPSSSAMAGAIGIGDNEVGGVHVSQGASTTLSENVFEGTGARFFKSGEGSLTVPLSKVNRQLDWNLIALGGIMTVTSGDDATVDVNTPPAILQTARLWFDQSSVVATNGICPWTGGEAPLCKRWVDVRDRDNPDSPSHIYATPAWTGHTAANYGSYMGVGPVQTNVNGNVALFFYGTRGVHLRLSEVVTNAIQFVVHGIRSDGNGVWGPVIGCSDNRSGGYLTTIGTGSAPVMLSNATGHFATRMDCTSCYAKSRNWLDGEPLDPFHEKPKGGFQLFETDFCGRRQQFDRIFYDNFNGRTDAGTVQGGDYVCEIVAFEDALDESDRLEIERYLMKKWNLPVTASSGSNLRYPEKTALLGAASNALVVVQTDGATTPPVAFSGEGKIRKTATGRLSLGLGGAAEAAGSLRINGGDVVVRSGRAPAQVAMPDSFYKAAVYHPDGTRTADLDAEAGVRLTRMLDAGVGKVVKQGNDWVRFNEVAADVKVLEVQEGTLQLESKPLSAIYAPASGGVEAIVPNADFEAPISSGRVTLTEEGLNGWSKVDGKNAAQYIAWTNSSVRVWFGDTGSDQRIRPRGNQALQMNTSSAAQTLITVPQEGEYEFECLAKSRYGATTSKTDYFNWVELFVGRDGESLEKFGEIHASAYRFNRYRFRMPHLEAGAYVLRFVSTLNNTDGATFIDNVRVAYVGEAEDDIAFKVPNGDFETLVPAAGKPYFNGAYSADNAADGWTIAVTNATYASSTVNPLAGIVSPIFQNDYTHSFYDEYNARRGGKALMLLKNVACARTTFAAPAGTFRLRATVVNRPMNFTPSGKSEIEARAAGRVTATLTLADSTVLRLGAVTASSTLAETALWATAFEIPEPQQVTLTLSQTDAGGSALVDDLVFVTEKRRTGKTNLIACPGAETDGWSNWKTSYDRSYWTNSGAGYYAYANANTHAYGYCAFEGDRAFSFQCVGILSQTISVPAAGTYRFTCHSRTRADSADYGGNGVRFWMVKSGSSVTNCHNTLLMPYCRNFIERSWLVDIPEPGDWIFGMTGTGVAGTGTNADRRSFLDGLSLVRADGREDAPSVPKKMKLSVASGARLVLDYPGTVKVSRLSLGGVRKNGVVNAATDPDYIGGIGSLEIVPTGIAVSFK